MLNEFLHVAFTLWPLFFTFALGIAVGKVAPAFLIRWANYALVPLVWGILWVIGVKSGEVLGSLHQGINTLKQGLLYGGGTSLAAFIVLWPLGKHFVAPNTHRAPRHWRAIIRPIKECVIAFAWVLAGVYCYRLGVDNTWLGEHILQIRYWLYVLLVLVGMELANIHFQRAWLAHRVLLVPVLVLLSSLATGAIISVFTGETLTTALALSSGFGWFSLSGALADQHLGAGYGSVAVITDLFRELFAIAAVFLLGQRSAISSIGVGAATATSTTLPFIRRAYAAHFVPIALVSGLTLSLLAPLLMTFFMGLSAMGA